MKVYSPNKEYTGISATVPFCGGVGETDDPHLIEWFEAHGYRVEKVEKSEESETVTAEEPTAEPAGKAASKKKAVE